MSNDTKAVTTYAQGKAVKWQLGKAATGTVQLGVRFLITDAAGVSNTLLWYGAFTDKAAERTIESCRAMGWTGSDVRKLGDADAGLGANLVDLTIETTADGSRIAWVNAPGIPMKGELNELERDTLDRFNRFATAGRS